MIKIESIEIINFKSIKDHLFKLSDFYINETNAAILVGLNESGKSTFLEAVSLINDGLDNINYEEYCNNDNYEDNHYVELYVVYEISDVKKFKQKMIDSKMIDAELINQLNITTITSDIYKNADVSEKTITVNFNDIKYDDYIIVESKKLIGSIQQVSLSIQKTKQNDFLIGTVLNKNSLQEFLANIIKPIVKENSPKIQFWKPSPEYLINETIDLNSFKENPNVSIPLKNIFHVFGKKTDLEIKLSIEKALKSPAKRDKLQDEISESITKHINKIWKEHKIKIRISINSTNCDVLVEDKDKRYSYYNMRQRSDGFKQFISLILSLSTLNESQYLKNNLILIDEPEVHLHPSGITYMREELLKIAKNNTVIISSHSQFMVDVDNPSRHFIVTKSKGETYINQVDDKTNFKEDSVLKSAFGLNLYKELLPEKIILVEGGGDKVLLAHCIKILSTKNNFSIKSAGGASKMPGFASLLSDENLSPYIIFDSDKEGKDNKKIIIDKYKESYSNDNVFTLKDLYVELPDDSTIEDLYPLAFIKKELKLEFGIEYNFDPKFPILFQLKNQNAVLKSDKQKLESLKNKLSNNFIKEYDTIIKLNSVPNVKALFEILIDKIL